MEDLLLDLLSRNQAHLDRNRAEIEAEIKAGVENTVLKTGIKTGVHSTFLRAERDYLLGYRDALSTIRAEYVKEIRK